MEYRVEFAQQSNLFEQQKCKKLRAFNGQQPHGRRHRGCGRRCGGEQKIREPQTFRKIRTFQAHPPPVSSRNGWGVLWLCLIFLRAWKVGNSCHPPLDLCALRARVETASSSGLLKKQDTQSDVLIYSGAGYEARTRFPASHELRSAIRRNPTSPLIKMRFAHGCRYRVLFV